MLGERKLFDGADFYLQEGDKVGVVGINGTGKTTLLPRAGKQPLAGEQPAIAKTSGKARHSSQPRLRFTFQEQRDYETIEQTVAELEGTLKELEEKIAAAATDYALLESLIKEKEATEALLEEKMERWMYLEELKEKIAEQGR